MTRCTVSTGDDGGRFINVCFSTGSLAPLWRELQRSFLRGGVEHGACSKATIVTCEGSSGWDDYLLLHHFDPSQTVDLL